MSAIDTCNYGGCKFHIGRLLDYVADKDFKASEEKISTIFDKLAGVLPWWLVHCSDIRLLMYHMNRVLNVDTTHPIIVLAEPFQIIDGWHRLMNLGINDNASVRVLTLTQEDMLDFLNSISQANTQ